MKKQSRKRLIEGISMFLLLILGVGLPILLTYEKVNYIEIDKDRDFNKYNFLGNGSKYNPYIIENLTISREKKRAISIKNTNSYFIIKNCELTFNPFNGIYLESIANGTAILLNNSIKGHSRAGIEILSSDGVKIEHNIILENRIGIIIENSNNTLISKNRIYAQPAAGPTSTLTVGVETKNSDYFEINNNTLISTARGITVNYGIQFIIADNIFNSIDLVALELTSCSKSLVLNNTFNEQSRYGINLRHSNQNLFSQNTIYGVFYGIYHYNGTENIFELNSLYENIYGIYVVSYSQENLINYNHFTNNSEEGVRIEGGSDNKIHHNNFFNNHLEGASQAYDGGTTNYWFDSLNLVGNYWSSWNTSLPYLISGSANNTDPYPQNNPISFGYFY